MWTVSIQGNMMTTKKGFLLDVWEHAELEEATPYKEMFMIAKIEAAVHLQ